MAIRVEIKNSKIVIDCDLNRFSKDQDFDHVMGHAVRIGKTAVDLMSFKTGFGLFYLLDTFTDQNGMTGPVMIYNSDFPPLANSIDKENFFEILNLAITEPQLRLAMKDLTDALTLPDQTLVSCARAVDAIRIYFAPPGSKKKKQGWKTMNDNLQLAQSYTTEISEASHGPRHGDYANPPDAINQKIAGKAWIIMNRFIAYQIRGKHQLPLADFPLLS